MCFHVTPQDFLYVRFVPLVKCSEINPASWSLPGIYHCVLIFAIITFGLYNYFSHATDEEGAKVRRLNYTEDILSILDELNPPVSDIERAVILRNMNRLLSRCQVVRFTYVIANYHHNLYCMAQIIFGDSQFFFVFSREQNGKGCHLATFLSGTQPHSALEKRALYLAD